MRQVGMVKSVAGAVLCGFGVTLGIVLSNSQGGKAWIIAAAMVVAGFVLAALPLPWRKPR